MKQKFLTKTIFKKSLNCPTAVYYLSKGDEYINNEDDNDFLKALGDGGYQVEYLAKDYYSTGVDMKYHDFDTNISETNKLLKENENIILFEPLFIINGLLVRVDILEKVGNTLKIIEVKAKGFDFANYNPDYFLNSRTLKKKPKLKADWEEYVLDVAFQKHVLSMIYPTMDIESYLYMLDKNAKTTVDGLHQKYLIRKDHTVEIMPGDIGEPIMDQVKLDDVFERILLFTDEEFKNGLSFKDYLDTIKNSYLNSTKITVNIGSHCGSCPFNVKEETDKKSGFLECWSEQTKKSKEYIKESSTVLDIWNYRGKDGLIADGKYFMDDINLVETFNEITEETLENSTIFTPKERQYTQIKKVIDKDKDIKVFKDGLQNEMDSWVYPINCIDFETIAPSIQFSKDLKPFDSLAFQFSHHIIHENGKIEHKSEYLYTVQGGFPNFEFIRALKKSLETNNGSIMIYSMHENSIMNAILRQLYSPLGEKVNDKNELISFIKTITKSNDRTQEELSELLDEEFVGWCGERMFIDLLDVQKKYFYSPKAGGSNSIKYVLPAILDCSDYLKEKYSKPIYGTDEISSNNFKNMTWITYDENKEIINPYKILPTMLKSTDDVYGSNIINNGGDAMTAYARLQFTQMDETERNDLRKSLLSYCELDTLAMVFLIEGWKDILK